MKTKNVICILIAMVVSFSVQHVSAKEVSITVEKDLGAVSSKSTEYFSYESDSTKVMTDMQINDMAEKLVAYTNSNSRLEEAKMEKIDGRIFMGGREKHPSTAYLDIDPTIQSLTFSKEIEKYFGEGDTKGLPDRADAPKLAEIHLEALALLPEDFKAEMTLLHVGGVGMATISEDGFVADYEKLVTVFYGRTLDGLPVKGASRIAVRMGINGELVGLVRNWPELNKKTVSSKDMIASRSRIDHLKRHLGSLYDDSKVEAVSITEANIVMYDDGRGTIEPAMFVLGEITQKDGIEEHADWIVPLLRSPRARYSILERVPVYPDNHKVEQTQDIRDSIIEEDDFDK